MDGQALTAGDLVGDLRVEPGEEGAHVLRSGVALLRSTVEGDPVGDAEALELDFGSKVLGTGVRLDGVPQGLNTGSGRRKRRQDASAPPMPRGSENPPAHGDRPDPRSTEKSHTADQGGPSSHLWRASASGPPGGPVMRTARDRLTASVSTHDTDDTEPQDRQRGALPHPGPGRLVPTRRGSEAPNRFQGQARALGQHRLRPHAAERNRAEQSLPTRARALPRSRSVRGPQQARPAEVEGPPDVRRGLRPLKKVAPTHF